jgi:hypothetical protein
MAEEIWKFYGNVRDGVDRSGDMLAAHDPQSASNYGIQNESRRFNRKNPMPGMRNVAQDRPIACW